jgi:NAD(P)H dehydrogenase (quinone)
MKIFILLGHTDSDTLSGAFASTYERAAGAAGHEVRRLNIGEMQFDPILHKGYKEFSRKHEMVRALRAHLSHLVERGARKIKRAL